MKSYKVKPGTDVAFIPGVGKITEGTILMGDEYAKFAPRLLVEVPTVAAQVPLESTEPSRGPVPLTEPAPAPHVEIPPPPPAQVEDKSAAKVLEEDPEPAKRGPGRPKGSTKS